MCLVYIAIVVDYAGSVRTLQRKFVSLTGQLRISAGIVFRDAYLIDLS